MTHHGPGLASDLVGTRFDLSAREIHWRHTTNCAAAVADLNPAYLDDTRGRVLLAPPLYVAAFTWPVFSGTGETSGLAGVLPHGVMDHAVHASEHIIYHRPIEAGDRLAVRGQLCSVRPTRAGTYTVIHLDLVDTEETPVVSEYVGTLFRGIPCVDPGRTIETLPSLPDSADIEDNEPLRELEIPIRREQPYLYDGCTDIVFPIHTSPAAAIERARLSDIIVQGTCTLALAAREIVNTLGGGEPQRLTGLGCRFSNPVVPGTTVRLQLVRQTDSDHARTVAFRVLTQSGEPAVTHGVAQIVNR